MKKFERGDMRRLARHRRADVDQLQGELEALMDKHNLAGCVVLVPEADGELRGLMAASKEYLTAREFVRQVASYCETVLAALPPDAFTDD